MATETPLRNTLVIEVHGGLRQEPGEAVLDVKFLRHLFAVVCASGTPQVEFCASRFEPNHGTYRCRDGHPLSASRPYKCVIDINKDCFSHGVIVSRPRASRVFRPLGINASFVAGNEVWLGAGCVHFFSKPTVCVSGRFGSIGLATQLG